MTLFSTINNSYETLDTKQELVISQNIGGQLQVSANGKSTKKKGKNLYIISLVLESIHTHISDTYRVA